MLDEVNLLKKGVKQIVLMVFIMVSMIELYCNPEF